MELFGFKITREKGATKQEASPVVSETRSSDYEVPQKVFIERDGPNNLDYTYDQVTMRNLLHGYYADSNFIELFYCLPEVASAVDQIARRVADADWQFRKTWNDEVDYSDLQFNRIFQKPNPLLSFKDFVYQAVCYEILTGKQFFFQNIPSSLPIEWASLVAWWNLPANKTIIDVDKNVDIYNTTEISEFVRRYTIPNGKGGRKVFDASRVLPMVNMSLFEGNDIKCAAPRILGAEKAIKNLIPVYEARGVIYIKRGALGFIVSKKSDNDGTVPLLPSEKQSLQNDYAQSNGLTGGKNTVVVSSEPVEFVKTAMSIQELQPFDETLADAIAIYATLSIPRHLVPSKDQSTFSNASADMKTFYDEIIIPWANRYAQAWNEYFQLPAKNRRYIYADFSKKAILQENRKEKATADKTIGETFEKAFLNSACTLNEWIVARGEKRSTNPIFDKRLIEMTPEEIEIVKNALNLKASGQNNNTGTEAEAAGPEANSNAA